MENLNAEQIKKALECCVTDSCFSCPYDDVGVYSQCMPTLLENALALITSQDQRIKELAEENERLKCEVSDLKDELKCEKETNAHLCSQYMSENHLRHQAEEMLSNGMPVVKAEAVRKMQSEIKERCIKGGIYPAFVARTIDQIAKEITEEIK